MCTPYIENQKWLPWQHPLEPQNRLCRHQIAWPRKPTPRIKQRVASYHTSEVIAHPKAKRGCHGNHFWFSIYGVHIGATWIIRLNRPCAAAMRPYVKLLWPLVLICYCTSYSFDIVAFAYSFVHIWQWRDWRDYIFPSEFDKLCKCGSPSYNENFFCSLWSFYDVNIHTAGSVA